MTVAGAPGALLTKEFRALLPIWLVAAAALVAIALPGAPNPLLRGEILYFFGMVALAASAVGHEFTHGTLPLLLALPVARRRLFIAKALVLVPMLAALTALAAFVLDGRPRFSLETHVHLGYTVLCAVLMAPWLTMLCRSPLAGAVFAAGVVGGLHLGAMLAVVAFTRWFGSPAMAMGPLRDALLWWLLAGGSGLAAVAGWRAFARLEDAGAAGTPVRLPDWVRPMPRPQTGHPIWLLVRKELRLQQLSFAVAAMNVLVPVVVWVTFLRPSPSVESIGSVLWVIYGVLLALLIGSLASAEERRMGTLPWQVLLPAAMWRQWAVKVLVVAAVSLLLSFALPIALSASRLPITGWHAGGVVLLSIAGLYVSSLCDSPLKAMAIAATSMTAIVPLLGYALWFTPSGSPALAVFMAAGAGAAALWFGFENHRAAGHDARRVAVQVAVIAAAPAAGAILARL